MDQRYLRCGEMDQRYCRCGEMEHTVKKSFKIFPSPTGMSLTKFSLGGNNSIITSLFLPRESLVSDIPAGDGNIEKLFYGAEIL